MTITHNLGFPRIGKERQLKKSVEAYWDGKIDRQQLLITGQQLRAQHWHIQKEYGLDYIPVGDFSWYDQVLDMSCLLGVVPERFNWNGVSVDLDTYFRMARGRAPSGQACTACEMTKWFDTNYHYIVPEVSQDQTFKISTRTLFDEITEAHLAGVKAKPVILGPITWLWLAKINGASFNKLDLLDNLVQTYGQILQQFRAQGVEWVQIDEPALVQDLPLDWQQAYESAYSRMQVRGLRTMVTTYFGELAEHLQLAAHLPVDGLHVDLVRASHQLVNVLDQVPDYKVLSLGIINGRNIWRSDLDHCLTLIKAAQLKAVQELWLAPSCSLLHVPVDLEQEQNLDKELKSWLAFAIQKLEELDILKNTLDNGAASTANSLQASRQALKNKKYSLRIHKNDVQKRLQSISKISLQRPLPYRDRQLMQKKWLDLPLFPTTTIGSFPQTEKIRLHRKQFRQGQIADHQYRQLMREEIASIIRKQEALGLDVLVHGEPERNDMVEYFGEQLQGFAFTQFGWVQSYGSRCVKPPIIFGDVHREKAMTVDWIRYAQSCTTKPVKAMLTGPVTILNWSFVRDDQPRSTTAEQIALALQDEVQDLEQAGIKIIQIDEAALRERLPLRKKDWPHYLRWAVRAFRITSSHVANDTQIHTHMCYSKFNDIIHAIADMDADVITIETSRSDMTLLNAFEDFNYPNEIGPGVYDIHSPNIPANESIIKLMDEAAKRIPAERLWVNPDCGLKTRHWTEVEPALACMVKAASQLRKQHADKTTT